MGPAPPPAGTLSDISPLRLYYLAASGEQTGLLTFQLADRTIQVQFRKGNPEHVSSSHREDSIAEFLKVQKLLSDEQLKQAEAVLGSFGNDLVGALFGLGILNPGNAFANLAEQALTVLLKAMVAEAGSFTYQDSGLAPLKVMPLGNRWAVLTAVLRRVPLIEVKRRLKNHLDVPLARSEGQVAMKDLPLTPQEVRAVNHLNGHHSLNELARDFPHDSDNLHRLVFMFRDLDLLSMGEGQPPAPEPPSEETFGSARPQAFGSDASSGNAAGAPASQAGVEGGARAEASANKAAAMSSARAEASPNNAAPSTAPVISRSTPPRGGPAPPILTPARGISIPTIPPKPDPARQAPPRLTPSRGTARPPEVKSEPPPRLTPSGGTVRPLEVKPEPPPLRLTPSGGSPVRPADVKLEASKPPAPVSAAATGEINELRATAQRFKDDNYFEVLGLSSNADAGAVKLSYIKLAKLYHPDTVSVQSPPEVAKLKEEIFTIVGQAYRILSDDRSRANYREIVEGDGNEEMLPLAQVLLAEETFERGRALVKARRFPEAVKTLDDAIAGSEDVAEFYAWRGYAKFFAIDDKKRAQAEASKDLQLAVKKSEFCASAHYFLGQISKLTGDPKTALKHFRKAVEIKPDHIDAKREVRLLTKK